MALFAGLFLVFANGPFQAPDEPKHFFRAYQISEGGFCAERMGDKAGGQIPEDIQRAVLPFRNVSFHSEIKVNKESLLSALNAPFNRQERTFTIFPSTARYFPVCYFPHAAGVYWARVGGLSPLKMMYAGRMAGLFCWIVLMYAAIRITPVFKWVIVLIGLMPMNLYIAASLSADTMSNAVAVLLMGLLLKERFSEKKSMTIGKQVMIGSIVIALSLMKLVYAPMAILMFMIPGANFGSNKKRIAYAVSVIGLSLVAVIFWSFEVRRIYVPLNSVDVSQQLANLFADPWKFLVLLVNTMREQGAGYAYSFIGVLGCLDTWLPRWIYGTYFLIMVAASAFEPADKSGTWRLWERATLFAACFLSFFLICTSQYLTWTKAGATAIEGVQGRYFIPLVLPALLIFSNRFLFPKIKWLLGGVVSVYSIGVLYATCLAVYARYYG